MAPKKVTLNTIKSEITEKLSKAKAFTTLLERLLSSERNRTTMSVLGGLLDKLSDQLIQLEELPSVAEESIQANKHLSSPNVLEHNRKEVEEHLDKREYETIKDRLLNLMGEVNMAVNSFGPNSESPTSPSNHSEVSRISSSEQEPELSVQKLNLKQPVSYPKKADIPSSSGNGTSSSPATRSNLLDNGCSLSSQQMIELDGYFSHRFKSMEASQKLLFEQFNLMNKTIKTLQRRDEDPVPASKHNPTDEIAVSQEDAGQEGSNTPIYKKNCQPWKSSIFQPINEGKAWESESSSNLVGAQTMENAKQKFVSNPKTESFSSEKSFSILASNVINSITNTIPVFDGNPEDYVLFRQMFDYLVHENDQISTKMKHSLLLKLLTGEARSMMRSASISSEDYETLRDNLERQFNRDKDTEQYYIEQLQQFSFSEESFENMEKELNKYCVIANTLKNKGCCVDDPIFMDNFIGKLPGVIMGPVFKKNREKKRSFLEIVGIAYDTIAEKKAIENARRKKKQTVYTNEVCTLQATPSRSIAEKSNGTAQCHYCDSLEHSALNCPLTVQQKLKAVETKQLCSNCLGTKHMKEWCTSKTNCHYCNERHHTAHCHKGMESRISRISPELFRGEEVGPSEKQ